MGAYSPVPHITQEVLDTTIHEIVDSTMAGLAKEDLEFAGIIYVGCMLTKQGPKVIEYNLRLGDPETQVLLPQLESDFYQMTSDLIDRKLPDIKWQQGDFYLGVVVAAQGIQPHRNNILLYRQIYQETFFMPVSLKKTVSYIVQVGESSPCIITPQLWNVPRQRFMPS